MNNYSPVSEPILPQSDEKTATAIIEIKPKRRFPIGKVLIYVVLSVWALTTIFPFLWVINNSFKDKQLTLPSKTSFMICLDPRLRDPELMAKYGAKNESPNLDNYNTAFKGTINVGRSYINSIVISGSVTIAVIILAGFAAFGLVRYRFKGRWILNILVTASLMFPSYSTIIPVLRMMIGLDLIDTPLSVILPQIAGNLSFAILILVGYIRGLPVDLEEAAFMEGCNVYQIFFRVITPITRPSFATVAIFTFLWSYNDLFLQKIMLRTRPNFPVCSILEYISSQWGGEDYGLMAAAVTIVVVPVLIVYIFLQKNIVKGLTAGAIKG